MSPFTQYKPWMIERYGEPLFRVPVQLASSCPHGRCAFCSENGSKAQQTQQQKSPYEQVEAAIQFSKRRYKATRLMLYIQAFTADLTDPDQQQTILDLLERYDFTAVSVGTRPDCLPEEALDFLNRLNDQTEVWVELGVQTANDQTLKRINRGHDWACSKQAIRRLAARGIHVAPHVILGLPGETQAEPAPDSVSNAWNKTAEELAALPISGIKIHNLHIMRGTALAEQYAETPFPLLSHWEYAEGLMEFLRRIPAGIPIMRISTDTPDDQLIAPHWHLEKGQFLDYVIQQMTCRQIRQGDLADGVLEHGSNGNSKNPLIHDSMTPVITADGSVTFFSEDWKEHYHTKTGARLEAAKKFVEPSGLKEKLQTSDIQLLDVCFGLGNNSLEAIKAAVKTQNQLNITALEMDKRIVHAAAKHFNPPAPKGSGATGPLDTDPADWKQVLHNLLQQSTVHLPQSTISLRWGDARYLIQQIEDHSIDIVFHDPFSSQHCPELWTVEFFKQLCRVMKPNGILLTYSSAQPVRGAMKEAGYTIGETNPGHQMGNGTIASPSPFPPDIPAIDKLDPYRSIPYRDSFLCATSKAILRQRQERSESNR